MFVIGGIEALVVAAEVGEAPWGTLSGVFRGFLSASGALAVDTELAAGVG